MRITSIQYPVGIQIFKDLSTCGCLKTIARRQQSRKKGEPKLPSFHPDECSWLVTLQHTVAVAVEVNVAKRLLGNGCALQEKPDIKLIGHPDAAVHLHPFT